jgi:MFS transporter, SP family, general alpha glucoside:H+ symporter
MGKDETRVSLDGLEEDGPDASSSTPDALDLRLQSQVATENEHSLSVSQALRDYRPAVFWSLFFCVGQMMTSFDPQLLGNLFAMPAFQRDFGYLYQGQYIISAPWQTGLLMGVPIGQVVGSLGAGYPLDWFGRRKTFGVCVIGTIGCVFNQFFARSLPALLVGELVGGLILGFYAVITPTYASEVCPVALRGILTANINLLIVVGQLLANGVCAGTQTLDSHWAYSGPFATQWLWPALILVLLPFAPESELSLSLSLSASPSCSFSI